MAGELRVTRRGQLSLPAGARRRWGIEGGGALVYLDLGEVVVLAPGGIAQLRELMAGTLDDAAWADVRAGLGDPDLATE